MAESLDVAESSNIPPHSAGCGRISVAGCSDVAESLHVIDSLGVAESLWPDAAECGGIFVAESLGTIL